MVDLVSDVVNLIIGEELAEAVDVDIFKDFIPDAPNDIVVVSEYSGSDIHPFANASVRSIQILCRAKTPSKAREKCWKLFDMFTNKIPMTQIGNHTCILALRNSPFKMEVDSKNRHLYVFNMGVTISFR